MENLTFTSSTVQCAFVEFSLVGADRVKRKWNEPRMAKIDVSNGALVVQFEGKEIAITPCAAPSERIACALAKKVDGAPSVRL